MILVTGGLGYIGSHIVVELLQSNEEVITLDNLSNSDISVLGAIKEITKSEPVFVEGDIRDSKTVHTLFENHKIESVIHLAGLKSVKESIDQPTDYYDVNVYGSLNILKNMERFKVKNFIFSSSATVYGVPQQVPVNENTSLGEALNPYGRTKQIVESLLQDICIKNTGISFGILRYFNPVGAHFSGLIGESLANASDNLMPHINKTVLGLQDKLNIYGTDYNTKDGTCIRDYIHVVDLAVGHIKALDYIKNNKGIGVWNLGTGKGYSVLEMVQAYENVIGKKISVHHQDRREGDVESIWANCSKAAEELKWQAERDLSQMIIDNWNWFCIDNEHNFIS